MGRSPLPFNRPGRDTSPVGRFVVVAGAASVAAVGILVASRMRRGRLAGRWALEGIPGDPATEIAPDVFLLGPWGRTQTNAYLVRDRSTWALVDAGWANDAARIQGAARSLLGLGQLPSAILLSHAHPDHSGSARELAEAWGCPVYAHPAELLIATGDFAAMQRYAGPLDRWLILPVMRAIGRRRREAILTEGSLAGFVRPLPPGGAIPGLEGWLWIHTPGHTPGHVAYVRAHDRVVLSGDALLTLEVNTWSGILRQRQGLSGPPWYTTWDREVAIASITAIADVGPTVLAPGHGDPLSGPGTATAVDAFADRIAGLPARNPIRRASDC